MVSWDHYGTNRKEEFERCLEPEELKYELARYQTALGKTFGLHELIWLHDIRSRALIAEAINDVPEFLSDQVGKMRNSHEVDTIARSLYYISDSLNRIVDER